MSPIGIAEISGADAAWTEARGAAAHAVSDRIVTLRFRVLSAGERGLEALRYARRAMLREEGTRGLEEGEPSLEDAMFTASDVSWSVRSGAAADGRAKLEELVARANRALEAMPPSPAVPRRA